MTDCMNKEQKEYIKKIQKDMLTRTNMTVLEAYEFAFRCWQCGYKKVSDNDGWIPCEKELPKEGEAVLACVKRSMASHNPIIAEYQGQCYWQDGTVIAWQPLPQAYVPEVGDKA